MFEICIPKIPATCSVSYQGGQDTEHVYNNIKQAYKTTPLPHAGQSDHLSVLFIPVYIFLRNQTPPSTWVIKAWLDDAFLQLQDCFDLTV